MTLVSNSLESYRCFPKTYPHTLFGFCTDDVETVIGILVCEGEDPQGLTPDAIAQAWKQQTQSWIQDDDPGIALPAWIHE